MPVTLRSLLELRALLDSLQPNCRQRTSRAFPSSSEREVSGAALRDSVAMLLFDERSSAADYAPRRSQRSTIGRPREHSIDAFTDRFFRHIAR